MSYSHGEILVWANAYEAIPLMAWRCCARDHSSPVPGKAERNVGSAQCAACDCVTNQKVVSGFSNLLHDDRALAFVLQNYWFFDKLHKGASVFVVFGIALLDLGWASKTTSRSFHFPNVLLKRWTGVRVWQSRQSYFSQASPVRLERATTHL